MSTQGKKVVRMGGSVRRSATCASPKALYARPMALRNLYTDAGSIIRRGQQEAVAAHQENAR
ncbi:hypothetical protein [Amycolatopsis silviterrae]|uniref:Uncharacterized protein n=1 Tax=Amycolatopsis silviterrae TaxID=1656914 RepID=A0ABW5H129_9PSEU